MHLSDQTSPPGPARMRTAAAYKALHLLAYAEQRGLSREQAIARFRLNEEALRDVDGRVPLSVIIRMWNELPALLNDPHMPLSLITHASRADPPLAVLVFLASPTLGHAMDRMVRYERVGYDAADNNLSQLLYESGQARLVLDHNGSEFTIPPGIVVYALAATLTLARLATKAKVVPLEVRLRYPLPLDVERYQELLGENIHFGSETDSMTLAAADLERPHPDASRTLLAIAEGHAAGTLASLPKELSWVERVSTLIRANLIDGNLSLADVAGPLGLSPRTLQRRLGEEGASLSQLVDDERHALALHHIQNRKTTLTDIAFRLGFSDQAAFTRAFSRWTSRSPSEHRRALVPSLA